MARTADDLNDLDDECFSKLFSSLDSITAPDDLKSATLDAIFSSTDNDRTPDTDDRKPEAKVVKFPRNHARNKNSHRIRIAGIAACFALLGTLGTAYNMPSSYACVDYDDTTLTLGINRMGVTVSADADSEKGKELIAENKLTGTNYRDSVGTAATSIAEHSDSPESTIGLSVSSDDAAQRASVKKGSSEAIEISGYKKNAKATKPASKANAAKTTELDAKTTADVTADDEGTGGSSFTINTNDVQEQKASSEESGSADSSSKYHPLSDDKNSKADAKPEAKSETAADAETETTASDDVDSADVADSATAEN